MQYGFVLLTVILFPVLASPVAYALGRRRKMDAVYATTAVAAVCFAALAALLWLAAKGVSLSFTLEGVCALTLALRTDGFRALYALVAGFLWLVASVFSHEYMRHEGNVPRYALFTLLTFGAALGVLLSDNLFTTFLFFEVLSLSSYPWVAHAETKEALRAADSYLYIAVIGGLCMLMGLFLLPQALVSAGYDTLTETAAELGAKTPLWLPCALMLVGFGAKAGAFPLHVWLPKAHPVAPAPASALLSGLLTKTGVFGVLVIGARLMLHNTQWGELIFWTGVATMLLGALLALLSNNVKRILACSSLSQIGMILLGAGLCVLLEAENGLAAWGTVTQMVNHSLFKLLLFLFAGVIAMNAHTVDLDGVRGFGRRKPFLHAVYLSGMLGISGVPWFSGYIGKSLLHESLSEYADLRALHGLNAAPYAAAEWLFLLAGGLTLAYMLKIYVCVFWQLNPVRQAEYDGMKRYVSAVSAVALAVCAVLPLLLGVLPFPLPGGVGRLSEGFLNAVGPSAVNVFGTGDLLAACKAFVVGAATYVLVVRPLLSRRTPDGYHIYPDRKPTWLDLEDGVYRPLLRFLFVIGLTVSRLLERSTDALLAAIRRGLLHVGEPREPVPGGNAFTYAVGSLMDGVVKALNYTLWRKRPVQPSFVYALAAGNEEVNRQTRRLTRSISFGLLMVCLGLFGTIAYLLLF